MNVLIVDDLMENRKLLLNIMRPYADCDMVSDGEDAVDMFEAGLEEEKSYDLVLLDIMMPGMDGKKVLNEMRAQEKKYGVLPENESVIIMVTALGTPRHVVSSFKGGCTDYIVKPVTKNLLLKRIRQHMPLSEKGVSDK